MQAPLLYRIPRTHRVRHSTYRHESVDMGDGFRLQTFSMVKPNRAAGPPPEAPGSLLSLQVINAYARTAKGRAVACSEPFEQLA